jgi:hypothetical protein
MIASTTHSFGPMRGRPNPGPALPEPAPPLPPAQVWLAKRAGVLWRDRAQPGGVPVKPESAQFKPEQMYSP